jgi:hypothetical protein
MKSVEVFFYGHACVQVNYEDHSLLCDPWFYGKVFNESWATLFSTRPKLSRIRKRLDVWISHEHPDHLHFPTLKEVRKLHEGPIRLFYRHQKNRNVAEAVEKLGYEFIGLEDATPLFLAENFRIRSFTRGTDASLLIEAGHQVILNQNDCLLTRRQARNIRKIHEKIDLWLFQFSLAGYYGNDDDRTRLQSAREGHLRLIRNYFGILQPQIYMPFASFISFCKSGNQYLNAYRVLPVEALQQVPPGRSALLWPGDSVDWDQPSRKNTENLKLWEEVWTPSPPSENPVLPSDQEILEGAQKFIEELKQMPLILRPPSMNLLLRESGRHLRLEPRIGKSYWVRKNIDVTAEVGDDDLLFFFKFPWGADTLNITGNLKIHHQFQWRRLAYLKHASYIFARYPKWIQATIAWIGAFIRSLQK